MDRLPFFYYDILSRITPGAAALATLFLVQNKMPPSWHYFFVDGQQGWKTVVVPLLLGGLTYAIGVFFEVIDSCPGWKEIVFKYDTIAFRKAWSRLGQGPEDLTKLSDEETGRRKYALWEALVFKAGMDPGFEKLFGHCHRFQAEYKMMMHLIYSVVLFGFFSLWANKGSSWIIASVAAAFFLFFSAHSRNTRRWLQTITFGRSLKIIDKCEVDPQKSRSPSPEETRMGGDERIPDVQGKSLKLEQKLKALGAFKDWSNYLLIATVAAVGWTAKDGTAFSTVWLKDVCVGLFALSTVYAILTLALIPHIGELLRDDNKSIYEVHWKGWLGGKFELMDFCFLQHIFFLLGIIVYAGGTASKNAITSLLTCVGILILTLLLLRTGLAIARRHEST